MLKNKSYVKMLLTTTIGLLIIAGTLALKIQEGKIETLKDELYLKRQNEQRATDYYESTLNIKTIQSEFNTLQEYAIQKGNTINMTHKYSYTADGALGIKHAIKLQGEGKVQYDVIVRFDTAIVSSKDGKNIKVQIQKPYVDEKSIKLAENSLIIRNADCNFWANKMDGIQAQKFYTDSFVESGRKNVLDLYKTKEKQDYINKVAISEVQALIRTLNLHNCIVTVEVLQ